MSAKIWVTAGEGRTVSIDPSIATAPGAQRLYLKAGEKLEVDPGAQSVIRQMRNGDLVQTSAPEVTKEAELEAGGPPAMFEPLPDADGSEPRISKPKKER